MFASFAWSFGLAFILDVYGFPSISVYFLFCTYSFLPLVVAWHNFFARAGGNLLFSFLSLRNDLASAISWILLYYHVNLYFFSSGSCSDFEREKHAVARVMWSSFVGFYFGLTCPEFWANLFGFPSSFWDLFTFFSSLDYAATSGTRPHGLHCLIFRKSTIKAHGNIGIIDRRTLFNLRNFYGIWRRGAPNNSTIY